MGSMRSTWDYQDHTRVSSSTTGISLGLYRDHPWDHHDHTEISHVITKISLGSLGPHRDQPWDH